MSKYDLIALVKTFSDFAKKSFRCCGSFCACSASLSISSGLIVTPYDGFAISWTIGFV